MFWSNFYILYVSQPESMSVCQKQQMIKVVSAFWCLLMPFRANPSKVLSHLGYDICRLALNVLFVALPCLLENIGGDCWLRVLLADVKVTSGYGGGRGGSFATGMSVGVGVGWVVLVGWCWCGVLVWLVVSDGWWGCCHRCGCCVVDVVLVIGGWCEWCWWWCCHRCGCGCCEQQMMLGGRGPCATAHPSHSQTRPQRQSQSVRAIRCPSTIATLSFFTVVAVVVVALVVLD